MLFRKILFGLSFVLVFAGTIAGLSGFELFLAKSSAILGLMILLIFLVISPIVKKERQYGLSWMAFGLICGIILKNTQSEDAGRVIAQIFGVFWAWWAVFLFKVETKGPKRILSYLTGFVALGFAAYCVFMLIGLEWATGFVKLIVPLPGLIAILLILAKKEDKEILSPNALAVALYISLICWMDLVLFA